MKRSEAKRKIFVSETKRKKALLISLWLEAKNLKRKEAKKNLFFSRERAKRMRNGSHFASFRLKAEKFFLRNRRTLVACILSAKSGSRCRNLSSIFNGGVWGGV
jgi:hypothetical protein